MFERFVLRVCRIYFRYKLLWIEHKHVRKILWRKHRAGTFQHAKFEVLDYSRVMGRPFAEVLGPKIFEMLYALSQVSHPVLFRDYTPNKGQQITITVGFRNAQHMSQLMTEFADCARNDDYLTEQIKETLLNRTSMRLDDFLIKEDGGDVSIHGFVAIFQYNLERMHAGLTKEHSLQMRRYYYRTGEEFIRDLFAIMEALHVVALNNEQRP